jgi:hypothetical protein
MVEYKRKKRTPTNIQVLNENLTSILRIPETNTTKNESTQEAVNITPINEKIKKKRGPGMPKDALINTKKLFTI